MKKNMLIAGIFLMGFVVNTICMLTGCLESFDTIIYEAVSKLQSPFFDFLFRSVTLLGNAELLIIAISLLSIFFHSKNRRLFLSTIVTEVILIFLIKIIIQRPRPNINRMIEDINRFKSKRIIYISCNPITLARDLNTLKNKTVLFLIGRDKSKLSSLQLNNKLPDLYIPSIIVKKEVTIINKDSKTNCILICSSCSIIIIE